MLLSTPRHLLPWIIGLFISLSAGTAHAQVLDKQQALAAQKFWDNRDWDWYQSQIPFFECPEPDLTTTYYYRWELLTKHLTYGSPNTGYLFTEFIDRPFWSGAYGAISCPAGHQLYEARWLRSPRIARDYLRYWFRTPGAQPRNYSTWLADSAVAVDHVHPDSALLIELLPDLVANYRGWEQRQFVPEVGLFWQTGHDDGMEFNINSRQTQDILRGAPGYRPSFNAYMWADAMAIAKIARLANQRELAEEFDRTAAALQQRMLALMWDERRQFFFPLYQRAEQRDGHEIKPLTKTYESGQFAGDSHGRELIGYVPWQFPQLVRERRFLPAWSKLMSRDGFYADFGPSTVERHDPMFLLQNSCCWWSGQSWPYATTQTLKALANVLQTHPAADVQGIVSPADYVQLLTIYAKSHRKEGKPYLAEALHPDTGSFEGHDGYNHSEHYFHSGFSDLVITGLAGLVTRTDDTLEVHPLAPATWDYFAVDDVPYRGHRVSILWDRVGQRYRYGAGLHLLVDGRLVRSSPTLTPLTVPHAVPLPASTNPSPGPTTTAVNFAVNNDGTYYPRLTATYTAPNTAVSKVIDGNYWYMPHPPNRWTAEGSPNDRDTLTLDLGVPRTIHTVKLYLLDDEGAAGSTVKAPQAVLLDAWIDGTWQALAPRSGSLRAPTGHRPVVVELTPLTTSKLRVTVVHPPRGKAGVTELEVWGDAQLPLPPAPPPAGNLAYRPPTQPGQPAVEFPRASASYTSRFDRVEFVNDGITNFLPTPNNRWTTYESPSETDWLQIDFGQEREFRRVELAIYDDHGGVQPPTAYRIQVLQDNQWQDVADPRYQPEQPTGNQWNECRFAPVRSQQVRIVFTHHSPARSGITEVLIWND